MSLRTDAACTFRAVGLGKMVAQASACDHRLRPARPAYRVALFVLGIGFASALTGQCTNEGATYNAPATTISSGTSCYQAGTSITATSGFTVNGTANVTFIAGSTITLGPGFQATASTGAFFTAYIQGLPPAIT